MCTACGDLMSNIKTHQQLDNCLHQYTARSRFCTDDLCIPRSTGSQTVLVTALISLPSGFSTVNHELHPEENSCINSWKRINPDNPYYYLFNYTVPPIVPVIFGIITPVCFTANSMLMKHLTSKLEYPFNSTTLSFSSYACVNAIISIAGIIIW